MWPWRIPHAEGLHADHRHVKTVNNKSLVSGDKETWITLRLQGDNVKPEILNTLNYLQDPTEDRLVVIMDEKDMLK